MRWLAVARYRFLILIRQARWIMPVLIVAILVPMMAAIGTVLLSPMAVRGTDPELVAQSAFAVVVAYLIHVGAIAVLCFSFGVVPRRPEGSRPADLMDAAPVSGQIRYWGDAAGIFAAALAIHLCTTPLLAFVIAQSPFPSRLFWYLEAVIAAIVFFVSTMASWALRASDARWSQTRSARSAGLVLLSFVLIVAGTIRAESFGEAVAAFMHEPSPRAWTFLISTIERPALLLGLLIAVNGLFVTLYSIQSARSIERI